MAIKIHDLTGAADLREFKEKFILQLSTIKGTRVIPLDYVVDSTVRATHVNATKVENESMDVLMTKYLVPRIHTLDPILKRTSNV